MPGEVGVLGHGALDDGVAHVEIVEIVASVTKDDGLEVILTGSLVREKLIFHIVLKIQQFVHDLLAHFIVLKVT